jgi:hypothetical protein
MTSWGEFATAAPEIAAEARRLIYARGDGEALLATVRNDDLPRIHPVNVAIVEDRLYVFVIAASPKRIDLERDGRYALHTHQDPAAPSELMVNGRARLVDDPGERTRAATDWPFRIDDGYKLFELAIETAVLGVRATANDWPPVYSRWPSRPRPATTASGS